jgi:hypothetical protein
MTLVDNSAPGEGHVAGGSDHPLCEGSNLEFNLEVCSEKAAKPC